MAKALRITGFVLSLICLGAIVYLSFSGNVIIPRYIVGQDKGGHFIAYTVLSALFFLCFCNYTRTGFFRRNILPLIGASSLSFVFGYAIELCQPVFRRSFESLDLLADGLGSVAGVILCFICVLVLRAIERRVHKS